MFNEYELSQIERSFIYSKERFENFNLLLTDKTHKIRDEKPFASYIFITLARFINYKEDIWIKDKKTKNITTRFSKEILDNFVFNGKFTSTKISFKEERKKNEYNFKPIQITNILKGKENDSIWIIDNIRDSFAHGHFYIDFDNKNIIVKNNHEDRLLHCSIDLETFYILNELITEERIGGYSDKKLTTAPILYRAHYYNDKYPVEQTLSNIKSEQELQYLLQNEFITLYCKVIDCKETDKNQKYKDLCDFYNYNTRLVQKIFNKFQGAKNKDIKNYYIKEIQNYIDAKMNKYTIEIYSDHVDLETTKKIIMYVREQNDFYHINLYKQGLLLNEILKSVISNEQITIERGVMELAELYTLNSLKNDETNENLINEMEGLLFSNVNSFRENKKLANLFILATNNFVCNKDSIYDNYFEDYNEFDISNFEYQDYSSHDKLVKTLKTKKEELINLNKKLNVINASKTKNENSLKKAPEKVKTIIQNNINNNINNINDLNNKMTILANEILNITNLIDSHKTDSNGNYINNNNKSFFNHLRNSFAHNNVSYLDDRLVYNRKILLEDYDDYGKLTFRCVCRYYDLVKLFNNDLFLEAITNSKTKRNSK